MMTGWDWIGLLVFLFFFFFLLHGGFCMSFVLQSTIYTALHLSLSLENNNNNNLTTSQHPFPQPLNSHILPQCCGADRTHPQ